MNNGDMIFQNYDDNFIFKDTSNNEIFKINQIWKCFKYWKFNNYWNFTKSKNRFIISINSK